jgi:hypothetical protein
MSDLQKRAELPAPPQAKPEVQHEEPQKGGSFTRNLNSGALSNNAPAPADKIEQE